MSMRAFRHASSWLNRAAWAAERLLERGLRVLDEIPLVLYKPEWANAAMFDRYGVVTDYLNGAAQLYPFEQRMVERFFPKPPARLLAHGVGGGRELLALLRLGYRVEAYEPSPALASAAARMIDGHNRGSVCRRSLQEWAADAHGDFDAIMTGWGMWAHIVLKKDRLSALNAFKRVCPTGPVLLSFHRGVGLFSANEDPEIIQPLHPAPQNRLQRLTRRQLRERLLRLPPLERGTAWRAGVFYHLTSEWELREEAGEAGYEVAHWEQSPLIFPHAVLLPTAQRGS